MCKAQKERDKCCTWAPCMFFARDLWLLNDVDTGDSNNYKRPEYPERPYNGAHVTTMMMRWFQKFASNMAKSHPSTWLRVQNWLEDQACIVCIEACSWHVSHIRHKRCIQSVATATMARCVWEQTSYMAENRLSTGLRGSKWLQLIQSLYSKIQEPPLSLLQCRSKKIDI